MFKLIFKRILIIFPVLLLISLMIYFLKEMLTTSVDQAMLEQLNRPRSASVLAESTMVPSFYFSVLPYNFPDSLDYMKDKNKRRRMAQFLKQGVNWKHLQQYIQAEDQLLAGTDEDMSGLQVVMQSHDIHALKSMQSAFADSIESSAAYKNWSLELDRLAASRNRMSLLIPTFHWHGLNNGYHEWIKKILFGHWGVSSIDQRPAWTKIKEALSWTLSLNLLAIILAYWLAFKIGEYLFIHSSLRRTRWLENILLFFHSIPRFFLAMILILLFASDTLHPWLHILPTPGFIDFAPGDSLVRKWIQYGSSMILPLICIILPSLAYIARMYAGRLFVEQSKPYAFFAWAQGLTSKQLTKKHLRKNAIIPMLTLIGMEIPALIGGSVVIEVLFNIPGMGRLMMQSIVLQDWVIVIDILFLTGILTVSGKLFTDLCIRVIDPRIR